MRRWRIADMPAGILDLRVYFAMVQLCWAGNSRTLQHRIDQLQKEIIQCDRCVWGLGMRVEGLGSDQYDIRKHMNHMKILIIRRGCETVQRLSGSFAVATCCSPEGAHLFTLISSDYQIYQQLGRKTTEVKTFWMPRPSLGRMSPKSCIPRFRKLRWPRERDPMSVLGLLRYEAAKPEESCT